MRRYRGGSSGIFKRAEYGMGEILIFVFFLSIAGGALLVNLIPFTYVNSMNIWGTKYIQNYINKSIHFDVMFAYVVKNRLRIFAGILIIFLSPFIRKGIFALTAYIGLAWGMVSSVILMEHGINGIRIGFFMVFPHFVFYGFALITAAYKLLRIKQMGRKKMDYTLFLVIIMSILSVVAGAFAEAYINTNILIKILENYL